MFITDLGVENIGLTEPSDSGVARKVHCMELCGIDSSGSAQGKSGSSLIDSEALMMPIQRLWLPGRTEKSTWKANEGWAFFRRASNVPSIEGPFRSVEDSTPSIQIMLNRTIIKKSDEAFEALQAEAEDKKLLAEKVTDDMVQGFTAIIHLRWTDLNHVNVSTIVHRTGRFMAISGTNKYLCEKHPTFVRKILSLVLQHLHAFRHRNLANVVWGLGKIGPLVKQIPVPGCTFEDFLDAIGKQAQRSSKSKFSHRHMSNFVYGLACIEGVRLRPLVIALAKQSKAVMDEFLDQELSNFVWALAKLDFYDVEDVLPAIVDSAKERVNTLSALEVSNIVWGLARMNYYDAHSLLDMLVAPPTQRLWMKDISSQTLSLFVWSAHVLSYKLKYQSSEKIIESVFSDPGDDSQETIDLSLFEPQHIVIALYAYSEYGHASRSVQMFVEATKIFFFYCQRMFRTYDVSLFAWSLMMMDQLDGVTLSRILQRIRFSKPSDPLQDIDIRQIHQCLLHMQILHPDVKITPAVPKEVLSHWENIWIQRQKTVVLPDWVSNALVHLEQMGYVCKRMTLVGSAVSTCTLDFEDGLLYAVEGLGYTRRYVTEDNPPKARYNWKLKILRALGFEVVELDEIEWEKLAGQHAIRAYLQTKIDVARNKNRVAMLHPVVGSDDKMN